MNEQVPSSIVNNYDLQQQQSGLIIAESRTNNAYSIEQLNADQQAAAIPVPHEKTSSHYDERVITVGDKKLHILESVKPRSNEGSDDYDHMNDDNDTDPGHVDSDDHIEPRIRITPEQIADQEEFEVLTGSTAAARSEYARLSAKQSRRNILTGLFSKKSVEKARIAYQDSLRDLTALEAGMAYGAGVESDDLIEHAPQYAILEAQKLSVSLRNQRLIATGQYEKNADGGYERKQATSKIGKALEKFDIWWGAQAGSKTGKIKKVAVIGAAGVAIGIPTALAGSILLGPIAGGALGGAVASKIAKGTMLFRINTRADAVEGGLSHAAKLESDLLDSIDNGDVTEFSHMNNNVDRQTSTEVGRNSKRVAAAVGAGALGGAIGYEIGDALGLDGVFHGGREDANQLLPGNQAGAHTETGSGSDLNGGGSSSGDQNPTSNSHGAGGGHEQGDTSSSTDGDSTGSGAEADHAESNFNEVPLSEDGNSIWSETAEYMDNNGYKSDNASVQKVVNSVLAHENLTGEAARHLPVGFESHIPREVLEDIAKKN